MRCQARRWAHSTDPKHEVEQRGYYLIGDVIKRRRLRAGFTQRELERLTRIDQTVISRLENGKQYGLRWSRFAILVAELDGLEDTPSRPRTPWWVTMGITPPEYRLESLRAEGLWPPDPALFHPHDHSDDSDDDDDDADEKRRHGRLMLSNGINATGSSPARTRPTRLRRRRPR